MAELQEEGCIAWRQYPGLHNVQSVKGGRKFSIMNGPVGSPHVFAIRPVEIADKHVGTIMGKAFGAELKHHHEIRPEQREMQARFKEMNCAYEFFKNGSLDPVKPKGK